MDFVNRIYYNDRRQEMIKVGFYQELSKYYDCIFPLNSMQIEFIQERIGAKRTQILDIAAGTGNHTVVLAKLGHSLTAVELDATMVEKIHKKKQNLDIEVFQEDMRNIDQLPNGQFDAVLCLGNSIVHLDSLHEIHNMIKKAYEQLNEQGVMIIQTVNYDRIYNDNIKELPIIENEDEGVTFIRTYEFIDDNKINFHGKLVVRNGNENETYYNTVSLYPLKSEELIEVLSICGFKEVEMYGNYKGEAYSTTSPATIVVAYK